MQTNFLRIWAYACLAGIAMAAFSSWAAADPPSRVARLGYMAGAVSFSPAGEDEWIQAAINRPLTTGDRLWTDAGSRAEIQVGGAMIRMGADTGVSILNLDDRIAQLQLTQGLLNVRVRRLASNQVFEVDTPNLAFTLRQPGEYRIEVEPDGSATTIVMRKGQGEAYGEDTAYAIGPRQPYRFTGTGLREFQYVATPRLDEFDRWSSERDRRYDNSASARYVSQDVVGYQDLDANGTWRADATYGNVWYPSRVASDWAPYRDGHWAWVDPWGWTWVDDAPWGFAVSHYGRWANLGGTWGWVPGPVQSRAYYAPALVAFVGGSNFQLAISGGNVGGVAWFPLGPREVYRPSYTVSRGYFENVNRSNTVINTTVINNYYNNTNVTNVVYANRQVPGAVVAVPTTTFVQSQPVSRAAVQVSSQAISSASVAVVAPVAPTLASVRGAAPRGDKPHPARGFERPVVARTAPPAAHVGFAAQQQQLSAKPGQPLDAAARRLLKPVAAAPAPVVRVVTQAQGTPRTLSPPPAAPGAKPGEARVAAPAPEQREKPEQRGKGEARGKPVVPPPAPAQATAPPKAVPPTQVATPVATDPAKVAPPAPVSQSPEQREKPEQRGKGEARGKPVVPPPVPPQATAPPKGAPPTQVATPVATDPAKVAPPAPVSQSPEQREKAEQRGKGEARGKPVVPPPVPPQATAPPKAAPPPVSQSPEQREKAEQRGKDEARGKPVVPPPVPPQATAPPKGAPPPVATAPTKVAPPAPVSQPPEQRGKAQPRDKDTDKKKDSDEQKDEDDKRKPKPK